MDTKRLFLNLALIVLLVLSWQIWMNYLLKQHPGWAQHPATPATVTSAPGTAVEPSTMPGVSVAGGPGPSTAPTGFSPVGVPQAVAATLGSNETSFPMILAIDPRGAGLNSVTLSDFKKTDAVDSPKYVFQEPLAGLEDQTRPLATRSITIDGQEIDLSSATWRQSSATQDSATYSLTIGTVPTGHPVLQLSKTFKLLPRDAVDKSQGFDVVFNQSFRNLSGKPLQFSETINGPTPPGRENPRGEDRQYVSGRDEGDRFIKVGSTSLSELKKDKPAVDLMAAQTYPTRWFGVCNSYFQVIVNPDYAGQTQTPAVKIASATAVGLDGGTLAAADAYPTSLAIATSDFTLQPGQETPFNSHVFFGPKKRQLLENEYYSIYPRQYDRNLVITSGVCGFLTFSWLVNWLYDILAFFHFIFRDWGIAIICLVCLVRLLLHPITKKSQISMMEMSKKGPEIERLKKKYADNKEELNKAMMEVMNPAKQLMGCLPMFLQTPIWIALWSALQSTFDLRQAGFLRWSHLHLTWISDLSLPDRLIPFPTISIFGLVDLNSLNLLPILVGAMSYLQQALLPVPTNMTPEQEQQRKMQRWMLLLFPLMLYKAPSGLNLYILTSSTIGMIESKIIRDHIKQKEEAEKAGKIIIDAPPTRGSKRNKDEKKPLEKKVGGLGKWLADLQAKVEEIRRDAERRGGR